MTADELTLAGYYAAAAQGISVASEGARKPTLRLLADEEPNYCGTDSGSLGVRGGGAKLRKRKALHVQIRQPFASPVQVRSPSWQLGRRAVEQSGLARR